MKVRYKLLLVSLLAMLMIAVVANVQASPDEKWVSALDPVNPTVIDLTKPISTTWHELYPIHSNIFHLTSWKDTNEDGILSASDQIDLDDGSWWHVDRVMVTIHWTWKDVPPTFDPTEPLDTEPDPTENPPIRETLPNPVNTKWHMIYPKFSRTFNITSWEDTDSSGDFNPSDQFDITFTDGLTDPPGPYWAHLDAVSTDMKLTMKWPNPQIPEFPLGWEVALGLGLTAAVVYTIWKRRPKI